ncbi:dioxygenase [Bifidobacterium choloepi]|uniref:dioxygenase n=1 Tax=Bifidobacterium choloepi TaxID=2614131 RepID=UPI001E513404|nr:dioxygenase [Bifidobacterium choloepi]
MENEIVAVPGALPEAVGLAPIENRISSTAARVPDIAACCSGIRVQGRDLHTFAYSTDVAVIRNTNADAILAVYPFTGEPVITSALLAVAQAPLFVGVGGGTTTGPRVLQLAMTAEMQGAAGVILNAPSPAETVADVARIVNIPVIATVTTYDETLEEKIAAGAAIINIAAGRRTADVVREVRAVHPTLPILASGGGTDDSMAATIVAGANALSWTPPSSIDLQHNMMERYRAAETRFAEAEEAEAQAQAQAQAEAAAAMGGMAGMAAAEAIAEDLADSGASDASWGDE